MLPQNTDLSQIIFTQKLSSCQNNNINFKFLKKWVRLDFNKTRNLGGKK